MDKGMAFSSSPAPCEDGVDLCPRIWDNDRYPVIRITIVTQSTEKIVIVICKGLNVSYRSEKKEETRKNILAAAGRSFRSHGYAGIGVDGLSKAAGVTSGAFYKHFGSKESAFKLAVEAGLQEVIEAVPRFQNEHGDRWVDAFADYYLGKPHRDDLESGCAMTTLSPEVVRESLSLHEDYEQGMHKIVQAIAAGLTAENETARQDKAWGMLSTLIGGLTFARAQASDDAAEQVARAAKSAALMIAGS